MASDMILAGREYDGKKCGESCPQMVAEYIGCYGVKYVFMCEAFGKAIPDGRRCPACLATPSARVLTSEMIKAVEDVLKYDEAMRLLLADHSKVTKENEELHRIVNAAKNLIVCEGNPTKEYNLLEEALANFRG